MSSSIWTRCADGSELRALRLEPWRVVEAQHQNSTRKLVASDEEQALLEELIEQVKPPLEEGGRQLAKAGRLHYLLATPFRYPPLRHGSRFGTRFERGIWYGAETQEAAFAEVAYYRLLFLEGTSADLDGLEVDLTAFRARVRTERGADLVTDCFAAYRAPLASPVSYEATQATGTDMRAAGVEAFRYPSARQPDAVCVAVQDRKAFGRRAPFAFETWRCIATRTSVEVRKLDYLQRRVLTYAREQFLVDGVLPAPAI